MSMGRKRQHRKDLPERVYMRGRAYYFVSRDGKWHSLGRDYQAALMAYAALADPDLPLRTLGAIMDRYGREIVPTKARRTQEQYQAALCILRTVFGHCFPQDVTPADIYAYLDRRPRVAGNREKAVLSNVYGYAIRWGVIHANPCKQVHRNPEPERDRFVTAQEFNAVRALASPVQQIAMDLAIITGLRLGDLIKLRWADWREDGLHCKTGKTGRYLMFARSADLAAVMERARELSSVVFGNTPVLACRDGSNYSPSGFKSGWQRLMARAVASGVERYHFHDLRSVAASRAENPQELLGHDDPRTTNRVYRRGPRSVEPAKILEIPPNIGNRPKQKPS